MTTREIDEVMTTLRQAIWHDVYREGSTISIYYNPLGISVKLMKVMCDSERIAAEGEALMMSEELQLGIVADWFSDHQIHVSILWGTMEDI